MLYLCCCQISAQTLLKSQVLPADDSIHYFQKNEDYSVVNQLIKDKLLINSNFSTSEELNLRIVLFSNQLLLRNYEDALQSCAKLDSIIGNGLSDDYDAQELGFYYHKKGVLHYRLDNTKEAIQAYQEAIDHRIDATSETDLSVIKSLKNLGHAFYQDRNLAEASHAFTRSINNHLARDERDESMLQQTYSFLSNTYVEMNDMEQGLKYLNSSIILAKELYGENSIEIAELYSSEIFQYYAGVENNEEMLRACEKAESILKTLKQTDDIVQLVLSNTYNNRAIAYQRLEDTNNAEKYYLKSSAINKLRANRIYYLIDNYLNLGSLFIDTNQFEKANNYMSLVKQSLTQEIDSIAFGLYHYHLAELRRHENKFASSEANFIDALKYFNGYTNRSPHKIKNGLPSYIEVMFDYALMFSDQYEQSRDIAYLQKYDSIYTKMDIGIQAMRNDFKSQESRVFLSSKVQSIYEDAIDVFFILFDNTKDFRFAEKCFELIEKNKSLAILEDLVNRQSLIDSELPEDLLSEVKQLEKEIIDLKFLEESEVNNKEIKEQIISVDLRLENLLKDIADKFPKYKMLKGGNKIISFDQVRTLLDNNTTGVIQYFLTERYLYLMYLNKENVSLNRIEIDSSFIQNITLLREYINQSSDKVKYSKADRSTMNANFLAKSRELYNQLIGPIESDFSKVEDIIVVPDKQIGFVPFDILSSTGSEEDYLIHTYRISYAYSMSMYALMLSENQSSKQTDILGFAPSFNSFSGLSTLPFNTTELQLINNVIKVNDFINGEATKINFLNSYQDYSILHLSTHGIVDQVNPSHSYVAFSDDPSDSTKLSNSLFANEIFNLDSNADLLVLSACETAIGEIAQGEGIMSLSRAWASTGIKSIVSTLWRIDDQFTSEFMVHFYQGLALGNNKTESLRNAKLNMMQNELYKHPYYWSSFTLMGDTSTLSLASSPVSKVKYLLLIIGAGAFVFWLFGRLS